MRKLIGLLLVFTIVFCFGACKPKTVVDDTEDDPIQIVVGDQDKDKEEVEVEDEDDPLIDIPTDIVGMILAGETRNLPFGQYKWRLLSVEDGKALIITEDIIERNRFHDKEREPVTWETCKLRKYLNSDFLLSFTDEEQEKILDSKVINDDNLWYGTNGGNDTFDRIFLLSIEEADRYFGDSGDYLNKQRKNSSGGLSDTGDCVFNSYNNDRVASSMGENWPWWLRTPGGDALIASCVDSRGYIIVAPDAAATHPGIGVRPALWIDLT